MSDEEIQSLERRIASGEESAWPLLDAALKRAGRPPRRVWYVWEVCGHYSDRGERAVEPFFFDRGAAVAFMASYAEKEGYKPNATVTEWPEGVTEYERKNGRYMDDAWLTLMWAPVQ